jgi:hypothetical protein
MVVSMTRDEILLMAQKAQFFVKDNEAYSPSVQEDHELTECLERFAHLMAQHERQACTDLLMGLHEAQSNNDNHNYYHYAANAIKELRDQKVSITLKEFKCTGCKGKWHDAEDAKFHKCEDHQ